MIRAAAVVALAMVIIVLPFGAGFPLTDDPYPHLRAVPWLDLALLALILAIVPLAFQDLQHRRLGPGATVWCALLIVLAISFAVQPSLIGAQTMLRLTGVLAIAIAVASLREDERALVAGVLCVVALFEVGVAVLQIVARAPIGIIGEPPAPFDQKAALVLPRGTMQHEYVLTGLAGVAAAFAVRQTRIAKRMHAWAVLVAMVVAPVGLTFSRAAALGLLAACAPLARVARADVRARWALTALLVGAGLPALLFADGWVIRAEEGADFHNRTRLIDQAVVLIGEHPLLGVGPGRYDIVARDRFPGVTWTQAVHDVPLLVGAEGGVAAGVLSIVLLALLGWRAVRAGPDVLALYLIFVPFMIADAFPYVAAQGTVLLGLWIGGLDGTHTRRRQSPDDRTPATDASTPRPRRTILTTMSRT